MGDLREDQLITTYGPGSIIDLLQFPVMIQTSSRWLEDKEEFEPLKIHDLSIHELIEKKLQLLTKSSTVQITKIKGLMRPPPEATELNNGLGPIASKVINAIRFPAYHRCFKCNTLCEIAEDSIESKCKKCSGKLEATRWIQICKNGHIHDFDWHQFMREQNACNCDSGSSNGQSQLTYRDSGRGGTFADIKLECLKCKTQVSMLKAYGKSNKCNGKKLWVPNDSGDDCNEELKIVPRGQSSVYVSETLQKISIPKEENFAQYDLDHSKWFGLIKEKLWDYATFKVSTEYVERMPSGDDHKKYYDWLVSHQSSSDFDELNIDYAQNEYTLLSNKEISLSDFHSSQINISDSQFLKNHFVSINKVSRIKIIKALLGFRRAFAEERDSRFQPVTFNNHFIPTVESFGEGIFFVLSKQKLTDWETQNKQSRNIRELLHSLSHLLMHEFSYVSGFNITELSEQIYFGKSFENYGILIYTGSGDSQCSMGGLSDLAEQKNLDQIIQRGIQKLTVCSNDPFCSEESSSCIACLHVPENCCYEEPRLKNVGVHRDVLAKINDVKPFFELNT